MKRTIYGFWTKVFMVVITLQAAIGFVKMNTVTVAAAELPTVNETIVTERVKELAKLLQVNDGDLSVGKGVLFTADGKACGHATGKAGKCTNCKNSVVVNTPGNWFDNRFGYTINPKYLPRHYGLETFVSAEAKTCVGFANFALWYIARADAASAVSIELLGTRGVAFTKNNLQQADIRIGDIIYENNKANKNHSFMFLGYVDDNRIKVLDCNWVGGDPNRIAQVQIHTMPFDSSYKIAITRAANYKPDSDVKNSDDDLKEDSEKGKVYGVLDLSSTEWTIYNVGLNYDMYADKAYSLHNGAELEILDKATNAKGKEIYCVYSKDLAMKCFVTAKYVRLKETVPDIETEVKAESEVTKDSTQDIKEDSEMGKVYGVLDLSATEWTIYNVGLNYDMYADKAYSLRNGAELEILDKAINTKGKEIYCVYSKDLAMKCFITAKYVKIKETVPDIETEEEAESETAKDSTQDITIDKADDVTAPQEGWYQDEKGRWSYYDNGEMVRGWFRDESERWYYLSQNEGYMYTARWYCDADSGRWYYLGSDGAMCTGWITVDGKWYYLDRNGAMCTGWNRILNNWFLLGTDGAMLTGWQAVNGTEYFFDKDGKFLR